MALAVSFSGKRVLVTGGGRGIGRAVVEKLYNDGAIVYTIDKEESLVSQLKKDFPKITAVVVDLCDWEATKKTVESFGPLDHLVNNAGVSDKGTHFLDISEYLIKKLWTVNFKAVINVTQTVAKGMIAEKIEGSIVNVASLAGHIALEGSTIYCSTKAAIIMLTKSMALELGEKNIRVNVVSPTWVNTEMMRKAQDFADQIVQQKGIIKRAAEPEEIADTILFLLSSKSSMTTGEEVIVDGGLSIH